MGGFRAGDSYQVVWLVRRLFRSLAQRSGELLEPFGISAAERAVLEFLYPDQELSVPEIAGRYGVSRQHVQVTVNALLDNGLLLSLRNPRHKRSSLITMSTSGRELFADVLARDERAVQSLFAGLPARDLSVTRRTLQELLDTLDRGTSR